MMVDLIMFSRFGLSDGGRETWIRNFLIECDRGRHGCIFNILSLDKNRINIISELRTSKNKSVGEEIEFSWSDKKKPMTIFLLWKFVAMMLFKKRKVDHVLAVGGLDEALLTAIAYFFKKIPGKRVIWLRTIYTKEKGYRLNRLTQKLLLKFEVLIIKSFFDIVIANGNDTAEFYREQGIECVVIPNGVDLNVWSGIDRSQSDKVRIAFVGRLGAVKGIESFLESIKLIAANGEMKYFEFHVVGDGPFSDAVQEAAVSRLLTFHGPISNEKLPSFLSKIDCCVALTVLKNFLGGGGLSNALVEQMAAGKTIIAWNNGIFNKILNDENSYLVKQEDPGGLRLCYNEIRKNRDKARNKGKVAAQASQEFSIQNHVAKFFAVLE